VRLVVAGRACDVRGFAVAGVETVSCETAMQAQAALDDLATDVGLFIVSQWFAHAMGNRLMRLRERKGPPVVLVLPPDRSNDAGPR
jgi:vacuolar-type H+-ATPase subunit F/Vma7